MRLDAHQHFWRYDPEEYPWMQADWPIRSDHLPPDLLPLLQREGLDGCVAVQARQSLVESEWLLQLADEYPWIAGVVGWVDLRATEVEEQLARFAAHPKFVGVRHVLQDEPDDRFILQPEFLRGLSKLQPFALTYDLLVFPKQLPAAIVAVQKLPEQPFVLDHIAKPTIRTGAMSPWREQIRELAKAPNVWCKVSGMVTEADWTSWRPEDMRPYLDVVFEAFGIERLMFGSDWPVCRLAGEYHTVYSVVAEYVRQFSSEAQERFFGLNASSFYQIASDSGNSRQRLGQR